MKEFICIIWDDFILFNKSIGQLTNCGWSTPIDQFVSDMGLVIPMGFKVLSAFSLNGKMLSNPVIEDDIIEHTDVENVRENGFGMMILPSGKVISICVQSLEPFRFLTNIITTGNGLKYGISFDSGNSDALYGFIKNSQSINECFVKFCEMNPLMYQDHYRIFKISELTLWISECLKCNAILPFDGFEAKPSTKEIDVINILEPKIDNESINEITNSIIDEIWDDVHDKVIEDTKKNYYPTIGLGGIPNCSEASYNGIKHFRYILSIEKLKYAEIPRRKLSGIPLDFIGNISYIMFIIDDMHEILSLTGVKINDIVIVKYGSFFNYYQNISNYNTALNDWKFISSTKKPINIPFHTGCYYDVTDELMIFDLVDIDKGDIVKVGNDDEIKFYINRTGNNHSMNDWVLCVKDDTYQNYQVDIPINAGGI